MDTFFQKLRDIQKKERTTGTLSEIDDSFYTDASNYLQELLKMVDNNPLSLEAYQLRDAQRITTEICERREFKIVSTAATNVQKSHDLFQGHKKDSELYDVVPFNTTPEEEEFYRKIVDMMVSHREALMDKIILNNRSQKNKIGFRPARKKEEPEVQNKAEETVPEKAQGDEKSRKQEKKQGIPGPVLDEDQIAMMFGQAPEEVFLDENNNPVKEVKTDITTPFTPPPTPEEDTVVLQNTPDKNTQNTEKPPEKEKTDDTPEKDKTTQASETHQNIEEEVQGDTQAPGEPTVHDEELVLFKEDISEDILDENEKTYGPFIVGDMVLLPESLVNIFSRKDIVRIIR